jgi:tetratricopeptide (TPR) repeat protein
MKSRHFFAFAMVLAVVVSSHPASAQSDDGIQQAQVAFDQAQADYLQKKYDEAAEGFRKAYAARAFPQFLYNVGASYHMKGKKDASAEAYAQAIEYYKRYLVEDPKAADRSKVEKTLTVLEAEVARLKAATPDASGVVATPSKEVSDLGDVKTRGLVYIDSDPTNANIYLDDKKNGPMAQTPWSGNLEGKHLIIIEKRGYKVVEKRIEADPSKIVHVAGAMSEIGNRGWLEVTSNVPRAEVFIDDKTASRGTTPFSENVNPGKHTVWISAEGYDEVKQEVEVVAGETKALTVKLIGAPVGYLNVRGPGGIEEAAVYVDGKKLCDRAPCRKSVREGTHTVSIRRDGYKSYSKQFTMHAKTETAMKVTLAKKPGRLDAILMYALAGGLAGGAYYAHTKRKDYEDKVDSGDCGMPDCKDEEDKAKLWKYGSWGGAGLAGAVALGAIYFTFRDKGASSTAVMESSALAFTPQLAPGYAGLGMEMSW